MENDANMPTGKSAVASPLVRYDSHVHTATLRPDRSRIPSLIGGTRSSAEFRLRAGRDVRHVTTAMVLERTNASRNSSTGPKFPRRVMGAQGQRQRRAMRQGQPSPFGLNIIPLLDRGQQIEERRHHPQQDERGTTVSLLRQTADSLGQPGIARSSPPTPRSGRSRKKHERLIEYRGAWPLASKRQEVIELPGTAHGNDGH